MSFLTWILLGFVLGFVANRIVDDMRQGVAMNLVVGGVGAVVAGWLFETYGMSGTEGWSLYSMLIASAGAILLLVAFNSSEWRWGAVRSRIRQQ